MVPTKLHRRTSEKATSSTWLTLQSFPTSKYLDTAWTPLYMNELTYQSCLSIEETIMHMMSLQLQDEK